ncbi:hypothetical protein E8E13_002104 [Curvularia kusanoi]|uniref:Ankyrin n=1 Tax=Curvularia kusanoi TaxID=90978 RepID=A0A9P4T3U3_CURKU|nr:hypothetical protein E8E13_002104 [Curvularia kusanoi]
MNFGLSCAELLSNRNTILNQACSNLHGAKPSWGRTLCISPPGGVFSPEPSAHGNDGGIGGQGGNGNGYSNSIASPPAGDSCVLVVTNAGTPSDLFIAVNPSLGDADGCDGRLQVGRAYCVSPIRAWNSTDFVVPSIISTGPSGTESSTIPAPATPTPTSGDKVTTDDGSSRRRQFLTVKELVAAGGDLSKFSIWSALNPLLGTAHDDIGRELGILMLDQGADVSVVDRTGCTPLAVAVADRDNDTSLVSALLATGADMSSDSDGNTPLHHVYQPDILKLLLQTSQTSMKRNNMGWTPLIAVAGNNEWRPHLPPQKRIEVCALMLSHGCDINASAINGITALHRAVMFRDDDVAAFLLEKGADVGFLTDRDQSALHFACMAASFTHWMWADSDYENIILPPVLQNLRLLLSSGSDLEARDIDGRTPIFYTLREYVPETKRPDPGEWATEYDLTRNKDHFTVFAEVCNLLCAEGANIQAQDSSGRTIRDLIDTRSLKTPVAGLKPT